MKGEIRKLLKENLKIIKENFILLLGVGLFIYGLFSFDSNTYCDKEGGLLPSLGSGCTHPATFYYYDNLTLILLVTGVIFIVIGLLKIRERSRR